MLASEQESPLIANLKAHMDNLAAPPSAEPAGNNGLCPSCTDSSSHSPTRVLGATPSASAEAEEEDALGSLRHQPPRKSKLAKAGETQVSFGRPVPIV